MITQQLSLFDISSSKDEIDIEDSDENYTPEDLTNLIHDFYGYPDLDPFSNSFANKGIKAKKFYSKKDDGLKQDWRGNKTIWINPPYSRGFLKPVVNKLIESLNSEYPEVFLLTNTDNSTQWYGTALQRCDRFIMPTTRLTFYSPKRAAEGKKQDQNPRSQTLFYFGQQPQKVEEIFEYWGVVCQTSKW